MSRSLSDKMKRKKYILPVLFLVMVPSVAQANAGTPLMWAGMLHLVFGNLLIGLLEGILLAKVFGLSTKKCIGLLIPANYFSAWLGGFLISGAISSRLPLNLNNAWMLFWLMVLITYIITIVLEFPFVALVFRGVARWRRKAVRASVIIQTVSYVFLFGWYWLASGASLYTRNDVVELSSISLPEEVMMYFISVDDGDVYASHLDQTQPIYVYDLNSTDRNDRLFVRTCSVDNDTWDLVGRLETDESRNPMLVTVQESFATVAAPSWRSMNTEPPQYEGTWFNFGKVPRLGEAEESFWEFWSGFWPYEGLQGKQTKSGARVKFSIETPFMAWSVRNATHLPGDKVLLQLGEDQICVYDPEKKQIALLTRGRGPIAVIHEKESNKTVNSDKK
jgi:hypothetical protein